VNIDANYIANVLFEQQIAKVKTITILPYLINDNIYKIAYVNIASWEDSENAYDFIQQLKNPYQETRFIHQNNDWWPVKINSHNSGDMFLYSYTTEFHSSYFEEDLKNYSSFQNMFKQQHQDQQLVV
jgi:hypothetical protein